MHTRSRHAFTVIELLVVVVVIGILAAIALPNYIGAQNKAKLAAVKSNMHTNQVAAEMYFVDTGGYSANPGSLVFYMPGGENFVGGAPGKCPTNPFTGALNETPALCILNRINQVTGARNLAGQRNLGGTAGQTTYCGLTDGANPNVNNSYAVTGNNEAALAIRTDTGFLILSNM